MPMSTAKNTTQGNQSRFCIRSESRGFRSEERSTAARLSWTRVQLVDCALQLFKLLPSFAELAFGRQALVVGKVFGCFGDERVEIRCGLWRRCGCRCASHRYRR